MDIHKPKPWHGWREFLKEYGIIVLGVLTALGAEAVVEQLHWRHQVEVAHAALAFDIKRVIGWGGLVDAQTPCILERLADLEAALDKAQETGRLPPIGPIPPPALGSWNLRAWSGLTYGQTLAHMPNAEQTRLAGLALMVQWQNTRDQEETDDWSRLQRMAGPGRRTNDAEIAALRETIAHERGIALSMRGGARISETLAVQVGLLTKPEIDRAWRQGLEAASHAAMCRPIPPYAKSTPAVADMIRPLTPPGTARLDDTGVRGEELR